MCKTYGWIIDFLNFYGAINFNFPQYFPMSLCVHVCKTLSGKQAEL